MDDYLSTTEIKEHKSPDITSWPPSFFPLFTSFRAWFHFLCWLALRVDLGGWQSRLVRPDRWLETEQPSSLRWTSAHTIITTRVDKKAQQTHKRTMEDSKHTRHTSISRTKREWERGCLILTRAQSTQHCSASQSDLRGEMIHHEIYQSNTQWHSFAGISLEIQRTFFFSLWPI